ncbi:acyl carrier protein [Micromonospora sp. WMMD1120]|uniref:acyl carrier protein n=1 Tax=Micromonospora sp. WMMD1120 TaxID=3016106 RepID=UPI0024168CE9|nr:acyl carrier protein [Micromonospora sp. WMMD1120]MDG4807572.1 acyl carrier protein [Micromonospora sp. WMMD1120]
MSSRDEVADRVRVVIAEVLAVEPTEIGDTSDLEVDFRIDSLELMEIGTKLEAELDVRLTLDDLVKLRTVGDAIDLLYGRLTAPAAVAPEGGQP